jgi:hypothetical protein
MSQCSKMGKEENTIIKIYFFTIGLVVCSVSLDLPWGGTGEPPVWLEPVCCHHHTHIQKDLFFIYFIYFAGVSHL